MKRQRALTWMDDLEARLFEMQVKDGLLGKSPNLHDAARMYVPIMSATFFTCACFKTPGASNALTDLPSTVIPPVERGVSCGLSMHLGDLNCRRFAGYQALLHMHMHSFRGCWFTSDHFHVHVHPHSPSYGPYKIPLGLHFTPLSFPPPSFPS